MLEKLSLGTRDLLAKAWAPDIELFHRDHELVVRVDLPGLSRQDINVDVADDRITISGERTQEKRREDAPGIYRSERHYGAFYREIPLPAGAIADEAKATFCDGVLEVTLPAPPETTRRGRRLEISETPQVRPVVQK